MPWPRLSAQVRLAAVYALAITAVGGLGLTAVTLASRESEIRSFDARLLGVAYDASDRLAGGPQIAGAAVARDVVAHDAGVLYLAVTDGRGKVLGDSDPILGGLLSLRREHETQGRAAFDDVAIPPAPEGLAADPVVRHVAMPFRDTDGDVFLVHAVARTTGPAKLMRDLGSRLTWMLPLGFLVSFAAAWLLEQRALLPIQAVAAAAAEVNPGTLSKGIEVAGAEGEVANLQSALNDALRRLDEAFEAQARFASNVSHELKTPIAVLLAQAQVLDSKRASRDDIEEFRDSVEAELRRLARTVECFLVLSRPRGESELESAEATPLLDIVLESVHVGQPLARQYGVHVVPHVDGTGDDRPPVVRGDPDLLRTMFDNLVANAIRFSPQGGAVDVRVGVTATEASVTVRDRGPGIPPDYLERVFDRFVQAPVSAPRRGGFGIGLNIAATVASVHGGRLFARNREDAGCEFIAVLPLCAEPVATASVLSPKFVSE